MQECMQWISRTNRERIEERSRVPSAVCPGRSWHQEASGTSMPSSAASYGFISTFLTHSARGIMFDAIFQPRTAVRLSPAFATAASPGSTVSPPGSRVARRPACRRASDPAVSFQRDERLGQRVPGRAGHQQQPGAPPINGWTLEYDFAPRSSTIWNATIAQPSGKPLRPRQDAGYNRRSHRGDGRDRVQSARPAT